MTVAKIQSNSWPAFLTIVLLFPAVALADNVVHPSTPLFDRPTLTALGIQLPITGDDNFNAKVTVRYRKSGTTSWYGALPLFRVHPESVAGYTVIPNSQGVSSISVRPHRTTSNYTL